MNGRDVLELVGVIRRLWPTVPWNVPEGEMGRLVAEWTLCYSGFQLAEVADRLVWCVRNGHTFPPGPAVLIGLCLSERDRLAGHTAPDPDEAWSEAIGAVASLGWYMGPPERWSHEAVGLAVAVIGWSTMCRAENQSVLHGQFVRAYRSITERLTAERRQAEMPGASDVGALDAAARVRAFGEIAGH